MAADKVPIDWQFIILIILAILMFIYLLIKQGL